jgi:capsular exopolysaccharide synthesis family protein
MTAPDQEIHLREYWKILVKRQRVAVVFFLAVLVPIVVYSFVATPVYEGEATVLVDLERNQTLNFTESGAAVIQMKDISEYFSTQKDIIHNRAFADRVVRKMMLPQNPYFIDLKNKKTKGIIPYIVKQVRSLFPEHEPTANGFPALRYKEELDPALTDIIIKNVDLKTGRNDLMKITFRAYNPAVAATMANGIAEAFIEHNIDIHVKPFRDAADWLSARLEESKAKVEESEKTLQKYREAKGVVTFESKENILNQKLEEMVTELGETEAKRQESEIKYNQIRSVIDRPELLATVPDIMNNLVIQSLRTEELNLKRHLSELSDKFGPRHPQIQQVTSQIQDIEKNIIIEARKMLNAAKADYEVLKSREASLRSSLNQQNQEVLALSRNAIDFNVIAGEAGMNKQFYELLLKKLQEASLSSGISVSEVQIVDYGIAPKSPIRPKRMLNIILGIIVGIFGGIGAAFFTDYMDNTIKTAEDVDKNLTVPFLDIVPLSSTDLGSIFMSTDPKSSVAESFRTIRTGLMLSSSENNPLKVILLTSSVPHEGKTTVSANLAVAMAQMGEKVLIIDVDLRRHNLHELFGLKSKGGLTEVLLDPSLFAASIHTMKEHPNLDVLTGGVLAPNPSELLGSERMQKLMAHLRERYDRIILDSPPVLAFSDALVLSRLADGVIMVVWGGKTPRDLVGQSVESLKGVGARILGVALNKIDITRRAYYYYPYNYKYYSYSDKGKSKGAKTKKA